jgi:hypothetical protein
MPLLEQQLHPAGASADFPRRVRIKVQTGLMGNTLDRAHG